MNRVDTSDGLDCCALAAVASRERPETSQKIHEEVVRHTQESGNTAETPHWRQTSLFLPLCAVLPGGSVFLRNAAL